MYKALFRVPFFCLVFLISSGCTSENVSIVNQVEEREANEIVVFLANRNITANKNAAPTSGQGSGDAKPLWTITVSKKDSIEAMAILNHYGLPRKASTSLLDLFAKQGLVSSEQEDKIRYQAGLAAQLASIIRKIDGVLDADVEISIPPEENTLPDARKTTKNKVTAAVYVKHHGVFDDPNSHLITKIKRLVAGSIPGLDINDVAVISDRSVFTDIGHRLDTLQGKEDPKDYVSIWSMVLSQQSKKRFQILFAILITSLLFFLLLLSWLLWKIYPILQERGFRSLLKLAPFYDGSKGDDDEENDTYGMKEE